jgi:poly(3-hydroxybutyrate) depolymerase
MHGGQDPILPVNGGQFPSALDMMSQWAKLDGCSPTPMVTETDTVRTTTWSGCRAGTKVVLQIVEPASHEWFGQPDATDVVWTFLSSSSRA